VELALLARGEMDPFFVMLGFFAILLFLIVAYVAWICLVNQRSATRLDLSQFTRKPLQDAGLQPDAASSTPTAESTGKPEHHVAPDHASAQHNHSPQENAQHHHSPSEISHHTGGDFSAGGHHH
jgi:predicted lipid-binding transport protein (Tim44 family)